MSRMSRMSIASVTVTEVGDGALVDVREQWEWDEGHAPQAVHLPMSEFVERLAELPESRPLHVICHVGGRSAQVVGWLGSQGIDAVNVLGGMDAWEDAGLPVER
jgi:rhodanese-related sulfurtransferase